MSAPVNSGHEPTVRDYALAVWQRKWIVILVTAAITALALVYSVARTPLYEASAKLLYEAQLNVTDPLSTGGADSADVLQRQTELANVASVIESPGLVRSARAILSREAPISSVKVGTVFDAGSSSSTDQSGAGTVSIRAVSPSAEMAARVANAYAQAFTEYDKTRGQARVRQAEQVVRDWMQTFTSEASRRTAEYLDLQTRLRDLQILEATAVGNFTILAPAAVPDAPFAPRPVQNGLMGLAAGVVLGILVALTVAQFDTRVRSQDEVVALLGMPILGHVRKMPRGTVDERPLVVLDEPHSHSAEAIRKLRGNLEFASVDEPVKSVFITSALQGEGKSVTVCNLALALAEAGERVVLVDGDLRRPQVHKYFKLSNSAGVSTVLTGRTELKAALRSGLVGQRIVTVGGDTASSNGDSSLHILTSGPIPPNPAELIASKSFAALIDSLEAEFDMVLVDSPALLAVGDTVAIARCVDGLVFLVDLTRARQPVLQEAANEISLMPCRKLGLVVMAKVLRRNGHSYYHYESHSPAVLDDVVREPLFSHVHAGESSEHAAPRRGPRHR